MKRGFLNDFRGNKEDGLGSLRDSRSSSSNRPHFSSNDRLGSNSSSTSSSNRSTAASRAIGWSDPGGWGRQRHRHSSHQPSPPLPPTQQEEPQHPLLQQQQQSHHTSPTPFHSSTPRIFSPPQVIAKLDDSSCAPSYATKSTSNSHATTISSISSKSGSLEGHDSSTKAITMEDFSATTKTTTTTTTTSTVSTHNASFSAQRLASASSSASPDVPTNTHYMDSSNYSMSRNKNHAPLTINTAPPPTTPTYIPTTNIHIPPPPPSHPLNHSNPYLGQPLLPVKTMGVPKNCLSKWYGEKPRSVQLSKDQYTVWNDGGMPHELLFTAVFVCPLSGEVFPSGRYGSSSLYTVQADDKGVDIVWYRKKTNAEHGAAARAYDCFSYRHYFGTSTRSVRIGMDLPYLEASVSSGHDGTCNTSTTATTATTSPNYHHHHHHNSNVVLDPNHPPAIVPTLPLHVEQKVHALIQKAHEKRILQHWNDGVDQMMQQQEEHERKDALRQTENYRQSRRHEQLDDDDDDDTTTTTTTTTNNNNGM